MLSLMLKELHWPPLLKRLGERRMRFLPAGAAGLLIELGSLDQVLALHASLQTDPVPGMLDMIPAAQTLFISFDPQTVSPEQIASAVRQRDLSRMPQRNGRIVEIPVNYDGEDLDEVALLTGLSHTEIILRHTGTLWRAAFNGFAPGFCYLTGGDVSLEVPRRQSPRTILPAGSVALAGSFSAVYPRQSPGGWQIIGTTPLKMWDQDRDPPAWLMPGDQVCFVDLAKAAETFPTWTSKPAVSASARPAMRLDVLAAPFPALFQGEGRAGRAAQGIAASGASDSGAFRALNRLLGNPAGTPVLEVVGGGMRLRSSAVCIFALTGAQRGVVVNGLAMHPSYAPIMLDPGDEVLILPPDRGVYGYIGVHGGFEVQPVLGSVATDILAGIGPAFVTAGKWVGFAPLSRTGLILPPEVPPVLPKPGELLELDVIMGPRSDWFPADQISLFLTQEWLVTQKISRVGKRLCGTVPIMRYDRRELPSEATLIGAVQVPHSGQPILFMADHPLTGGYPTIGVIAQHHIDLAAQAPPGTRLRFRSIADFIEIKG